MGFLHGLFTHYRKSKQLTSPVVFCDFHTRFQPVQMCIISLLPTKPSVREIETDPPDVTWKLKHSQHTISFNKLVLSDKLHKTSCQNLAWLYKSLQTCSGTDACLEGSFCQVCMHTNANTNIDVWTIKLASLFCLSFGLHNQPSEGLPTIYRAYVPTSFQLWFCCK